MPERACGTRPRLLHYVLLLGLLGGLAVGLWLSGSAVRAQGGLPSKPDIHTITALHQGLRVYWWAPPSDGGSPLTGYEVQYRADETTGWTDAGHSGPAQPAVLTGLRFNTSYELRVRARNANGAGPWSDVDSRRTSPDDGLPDPPWPPMLKPGDGKLEVSWTAPAYSGGSPILDYRLRYTTDEGETWRSWAPGGNSRITGTSTTVTGLDNGVLIGVVVAARNRAGTGRWSSLTPAAEATPAAPLTLSLESSRELCTANTLTELSWEITGGVPPYALMIDGQKVDPNAESHRVNCGPMQIDPQTEEPLPNQKKTFSGSAMDSRTSPESDVADVDVPLTSALPAPKELTYAPGVGQVETYWEGIWGAGSQFPTEERDSSGVPVGAYLVRFRAVGETLWRYLRHNALPDSWNQPGRATYEMEVAAMRHLIELETPDALSWSKRLRYAEHRAPENVTATATHDTITVLWDKQPYGGHGFVAVYNSSGRVARRFQETDESGRHQLQFPNLPGDTEYKVEVYMATYDSFPYTTVTVRTRPAPAGSTPLPRGPKNVSATSTHDRITISWDAPFDGAEPRYLVQVFETGAFGEEVDWHWVNSEPFEYVALGKAHPLTPSTKYRVKIIHLAIPNVEISVEVTTRGRPEQGAQAQGAGGNLEPWFDLRSFRWPVKISRHHILTDDPYVWRDYGRPGADARDRYHAGIDLGGVHVGASARGDSVYAAGTGIIRIFNDSHESPPKFGYVYYCPDPRLPFHQQFSTYEIDGKTCNALVGVSTGRTALVFHADGANGGYVTKYAHLERHTINTDLVALLKQDRCNSSDPGKCPVDHRKWALINRGTMIGTIGSSGERDHLNETQQKQYGDTVCAKDRAGKPCERAFIDPHLHFEIREFRGDASGEWYKVLSGCADSEVTTEEYCEWTADRRLPTVLDPEKRMPPLPASPIPQDGTEDGRTVRDAAHKAQVYQAFEIASARALGSGGLSVAAAFTFWRPWFYTRYYDPGDYPRPTWRGTRGTHAGVDRYFAEVWCPPLSAVAVPAASSMNGAEIGEVPRATRPFTLASTQPTCTLRIVTGNSSHPGDRNIDPFTGRRLVPREKVTLMEPEATVKYVGILQALAVPTSGSLANAAFHLYRVNAEAGERHQVCAAWSNGACAQEPIGRDTAFELFGPSGENLLKSEDSSLSWDSPVAAKYVVLVRGGYLRRPFNKVDHNAGKENPPYSGAYEVHYTKTCSSAPDSRSNGVREQSGNADSAPRGQSAERTAATATQQCPPPSHGPPIDLKVSMVTATTARLEWKSGDAKTTGYRLSRDRALLDPQPDLGGATSYTFSGLTTARTEHVFSVIATGDLIRDSEPATLTLLLPPSNPSATATHDSIKLTWNPPNPADRVERYELKRLAGDVACVGDSGATVNHERTARTFTHTFTTGIEANKEYTLCVRAANAEGPSAWASARVTTKARPVAPPLQPDPPSDPDPPDDDNGGDDEVACDPDSKPDASDTLRSTETDTEQDGPAERTRTRSVSQKRSRSVSCGSDGTWVTGDWENQGDPSDGDWVPGAWTCTTPLPTRPAPKPQTVTVSSTTPAWVVSGGVARKQQTVTKRDDTNVFKWSGPKACAWLDDWNQGTAYTETKTLETKIRPMATFDDREASRSSWTAWELEGDGTVICYFQQYRYTRFVTETWITTHSWTGSRWAPRTSLFHTSAVMTRKASLPMTRPVSCFLSSGADGVAGAADEPRQFLLEGDYVFNWADQNVSFSVPKDARINLDWRVLSSGVRAAVLSDGGSGEVLVYPGAPGSANDRDDLRSAALRSIERSITQSSSVAAQDSGAQGAACPPVPDDAATAVDLDLNRCVTTATGGPLRVAAAGRELSLRLSDDRYWVIARLNTEADSGLGAVALFDVASASSLLLDPATGEELERTIPDGAGADLSVLLDAVAASVKIITPPPESTSAEEE